MFALGVVTERHETEGNETVIVIRYVFFEDLIPFYFFSLNFIAVCMTTFVSGHVVIY